MPNSPPSSTRFSPSPALRVELQPSRYLARAILLPVLACSGLSLYYLWRLHWWQGVPAVLILAVLVWLEQRARNRAATIEVYGEDWLLHWRGQWQSVQPVGPVTCLDWVTAFSLRDLTYRKRYHFFLLSDASDADSLRRLRVRLRLEPN